MKISNNINMKAFIIETLKNKSIQSLLDSGQEKSFFTASTSPTPSQLSQLIKAMNLYPLLFQSSSTPPTLLSFLLTNFVMPQKPELATRWLAEGQADKSLANTLKQLSSISVENEDNSKLKATLMLIAEQRTLENHKAGEASWMFPLSEKNPALVNVEIKKKQGKKQKRTCWCITMNLTLSKNRQLTATASLEENALSLNLSTDSKGLAKELHKSWPILERKLSKHHILISDCTIHIVERKYSSNRKMGLNIQV